MAKNDIDAAIAALKSQIGDLERAIDALLSVRGSDTAAEPKKRGPRKKKGLPQNDTGE